MSPDTRRLIDPLFHPADRADAAALLERDCGRNLPFCEDLTEAQLERFRFAAIRLSEGSLDRLAEVVVQAQTDWRDLLMMAGFAHDPDEHRAWCSRVLGRPA